MKNLAMFLMTCVLSTPAFAADFSLEVGFRQQSGSLESETDSVKSQMGYQLGAVGVLPISGPWGVRSGLMYVSRPLSVESDLTGDETKITMNYFEVPAAISYKFEDYASLFAGLALSFHLDTNVSNNTRVRGEKSLFTPVVVGASFKFAPQMGGTLFFESGSGAVADGYENYRAVGASLSVFFE